MVEIISVDKIAEDERGATHYFDTDRKMKEGLRIILIQTEPDNSSLLIGKVAVSVADITIRVQHPLKILSS